MRTNLGTNSALPWVLTLAGTIGFSSFAVAGPMPDCGSGAGNIKDEAMCVGRGPDSLPGSDDRLFSRHGLWGDQGSSGAGARSRALSSRRDARASAQGSRHRAQQLDRLDRWKRQAVGRHQQVVRWRARLPQDAIEPSQSAKSASEQTMELARLGE